VKHRLQQYTPMLYSPMDGVPLVGDPVFANNYRAVGGITWVYNPWTKVKRAPQDIESDPFGILILPPGEELIAADPGEEKGKVTLRFSPRTGDPFPNAVCWTREAFRWNHKGIHWLYNPWSGRRRLDVEIHADPYGFNLSSLEPSFAEKQSLVSLSFHPGTGEALNGDTVFAHNFRGITWKYNPWSGSKRDPTCVHRDPCGVMLMPLEHAQPPDSPDGCALGTDGVILTKAARTRQIVSHPLHEMLVAAIEQAMYGKGERHGGAKVEFLQQQWVALAAAHGRGFLTGQAAKKLNEAAAGKVGEEYERELLGAIVYIGMALLKHKGRV
jgi:hypothetical protein